MANKKPPECSKTHSAFAPAVQRRLESAFEKVRRFTAQRRLAGARPATDEQCAEFIDNAMDDILGTAVQMARRARKDANDGK